MDGVSSNNLLKELFNTLVNNVLIQALEVLFEVLCLPGEPGGRLVWWLRGPVEWGRWESPRRVFSNPRLSVCNLVKPNLHYWMLYWTSKDVADPRGLSLLTTSHYCLFHLLMLWHTLGISLAKYARSSQSGSLTLLSMMLIISLVFRHSDSFAIAYRAYAHSIAVSTLVTLNVKGWINRWSKQKQIQR